MSITSIGTPTITRGGASTGGTATSAFGTGQTPNAGDLLVLVAMLNDSTSVTSITTPSGYSVAAQVGNTTLSSSHATISIFTATAVGGGGDSAPSITYVTVGTSVSATALYVLRGANTSSPIDTSGTVASGASSGTLASITITTSGNVAAAGEFAIAAGSLERSSVVTGTWTAGAGFNNDITDWATSSRSHLGIDSLASPSSGSAASDAATFTSESASFTAGAIVVFQANTALSDTYTDVYGDIYGAGSIFDGITSSGAQPGQAWQSRFRHNNRKRPVVLYDQPVVVLSFTGSSTAPLTFGANTAGYQTIISSNPSGAQPSPAWQNRFLPERLTKQAVLYDYRLTFAGSYNNPGGDIAFGAITLGQQAIYAEPDIAIPGPAWFNQFRAYLGKQPVLTDYQLTFTASYKSAGDLAFGASATGAQSFLTINSDPVAALPGQAFQNFFMLRRRTKQPVVYDNLIPFQVVANYVNPAGDIAFGAITVGIQFFRSDPVSALPGPAWQNRFRVKRKNIVLYDSQPSIRGPYCLDTDAELLLTQLGGTATLASLDATDGGTATDVNTYGGTSVDAFAGLGGSEINDTLGGSGVDTNEYGGFLFGGCYD